jgi:hypothetical protein
MGNRASTNIFPQRFSPEYSPPIILPYKNSPLRKFSLMKTTPYDNSALLKEYYCLQIAMFLELEQA